MVLSHLFGKETIVGLDIGSRQIKVIAAEPIGGDRWRIVRADCCPTPPDAIKDGIVVEREATAAAIRSLLLNATLTHASGAVVAVAGPGVIVRQVQLPKMSEAALRKSVRYEAAKYISTSVDDCCVEFEILGPSPDYDDKMDVMLVAAPLEMIGSRLASLELAGLEPIAVDFEAFAVQRALIDLSPTAPGAGVSIAVLTIGASASELSIVCNGHFTLTRSIAIGGDSITNGVKHSQKVSFDEAEGIKRGVDMSSLLKPEEHREGAELAKSVQPIIDEILREVRRSINYFKSQFVEGSISLPNTNETTDDASGLGQVGKMVITGGGALLVGLERYMAARLGMTVEIWNSFENPRFDASAISTEITQVNHPLYTLCLGLAVKESASEGDREVGPALKQAA